MSLCARRVSPSSRALAALLALSGFALPVLGALHAASSRHVACAEHGEFVEGDAQASVALHDHRIDTAQFERGDSPTVPAHGHEHCAVLAQARQGALPAAVQRTAARDLVLLGLREAAERVVAPSAIPLLHLAPKSSPPAARS